MFEGLLERILQEKLGRYLDGLDKENLKVGVWSGNLLLENLKVKKSALDEFKLPIKVVFGRIGKLNATVPWRSLSSSPVEIILEGLQLVMTPVLKDAWKVLDLNSPERKLAKLEEYTADLVRKIIGEGEEEEGYFGRMLIKILDNL